MSKQREALEKALLALEIAPLDHNSVKSSFFEKRHYAIIALREALDEPEQEPEQKPEPEPMEILEFPERVTLADLEYAQATPKEWSDEYRNIWQSLQVSEANNMMLRKYAHKLREALAESEPWTPDDMAYRPGGLSMNEPRPVAWMLEWTYNGDEHAYRLYDDETHCVFDAENDGGVCTPLYTAPAAGKPLTDSELWAMWVDSPSDVLRFARAIERAHGIGD